jgi:hypothetical protein
MRGAVSCYPSCLSQAFMARLGAQWKAPQRLKPLVLCHFIAAVKEPALSAVEGLRHPKTRKSLPLPNLKPGLRQPGAFHWRGGPHNAGFVVWGISDFATLASKPTQTKTRLEWATRPILSGSTCCKAVGQRGTAEAGAEGGGGGPGVFDLGSVFLRRRVRRFNALENCR